MTSQTPTNNVARVNAKKSLENQRNKGFYGGEKIMKEPFAFLSKSFLILINLTHEKKRESIDDWI